MKEEISSAIVANQAAFGLDLTAEQVGRLASFYDIVQEHNPVMHLVGPCSAEEFAVRHILESLTLLKHLSDGAKIADVGAGAGLPSIPCLLVREDLKTWLVESKERKARFLTETIERLGLSDRAEVVNKQFIETHAADATHVTCRALDKFTEMLPRLVRWAKGRPLVLFGGPSLGEALAKNKVRSTAELMPLSDRRYLYAISGISP